MEPKRRSAIIFILLFAAWALVVAWQIEEHVRVRDAAKTDLRNRSREVANTVGAAIRGMGFRGAVFQERLEPVLRELVNSRTNELLKSSELISIVLINANGEPVVAAGRPVDFSQQDILQEGEHWGRNSVTFVNPIAGANIGETNRSFLVPPPPREFTNGMRGEFRRDFHRIGQTSFESVSTNADGALVTNQIIIITNQALARNESGVGGEGQPPPGPPPDLENGPKPPPGSSNAPPENRPPPERHFRRPPWMRGMDEKDFEALISKRELHGLVLAMSTANLQATSQNDLWLRCVIAFFAGVSAIGVGLAWRNVARNSELQIRLIRASELTTHLREMNLAVAGLAHETRNPLNIIRGMAQMISKQPDAPPEIRDKARAMVDETDKVTAQLNEFINYSRPREVRRAPLQLNAAVNEVVRALGYDLEEKKIRLEVKTDPTTIEADEQLFRQALFNLVLNATQAVGEGGQIQIVSQRNGGAEVSLEVRDDGPGVPPDRRQEIFKPYFTTHQKGTGLGLAVVQQIVLAHGWEIQCLPNEPKGARFRITHLKIAS
jgi:signal transduction histidine kinase